MYFSIWWVSGYLSIARLNSLMLQRKQFRKQPWTQWSKEKILEFILCGRSKIWLNAHRQSGIITRSEMHQIHLLSYVYECSCLHARMYTMCVPGGHRGQSGYQIPWNWSLQLQLELTTGGSLRVLNCWVSSPARGMHFNCSYYTLHFLLYLNFELVWCMPTVYIKIQNAISKKWPIRFPN